MLIDASPSECSASQSSEEGVRAGTTGMEICRKPSRERNHIGPSTLIDLDQGVGTVHPVPGVPARDPQDHEEPRPLHQRRRDQTAVASDPRHRRQTSPEPEPKNAACSEANAKPTAGSSKANTSTAEAGPSSSPTPTGSPITSTEQFNIQQHASYTEDLTSRPLDRRSRPYVTIQ
jgi:hypothetical protein